MFVKCVIVRLLNEGIAADAGFSPSVFLAPRPGTADFISFGRTMPAKKHLIWTAGLIVASAVLARLDSPAWASQTLPVGINLESVTVSSCWYTIVFSVTNAGTKPVRLTSCGCSMLPTNLPLPLGIFGHCDVGPCTNAIMSHVFRPGKSGLWSWRFTVFEEASTIEKSKLAVARLKANVPGSSHYSKVWFSSLTSARYEITTPGVLVGAECSADVSKRPPDLQADGPFPTVPANDMLDDWGQLPLAEPSASPNGGPATPFENSESGRGRHR